MTQPPPAPITSRPSFFKRKYLINPKFQFRFLFVFMAIILCTQIFTYIQVTGTFHQFYNVIEGQSIPANEPFLVALQAETLHLYVVMASTSVLVLIVAGLVGVVLTHKLAGPLFRLKNQMDQIEAGAEITDVKFRKDDFYPELADSFNRMMSKLMKKPSGK